MAINFNSNVADLNVISNKSTNLKISTISNKSTNLKISTIRNNSVSNNKNFYNNHDSESEVGMDILEITTDGTDEWLFSGRESFLAERFVCMTDYYAEFFEPVVSFISPYLAPYTEHITELCNVSEKGVKSICAELGVVGDKIISGDVELNDLVNFGSSTSRTLVNILEELWMIDACCTLVEVGDSIISGAQNFFVGMISDYGPLDLLILNEEQEDEFLFSDISELKSRVYYDANYSLSVEECNLLIKYYYSKDELIDSSILQAMIRYYQKQGSKGINSEFNKILDILYEMNSSELSIESQRIALSNLFRLNSLGYLKLENDIFYSKTSFGSFIDQNSLMKNSDNLAQAITEGTESLLIYGAQATKNGILGFSAALIPFIDLVYKPTEYKEGQYLSEELGENVYNEVAESSYDIGGYVGIVYSIGLEILLGALTAGTSTVATAPAKVVSGVDKAADVINLVDDVSDVSKVGSKVISLMKKAGDNILDFITGGTYKPIKSFLSSSLADVAADVGDVLEIIDDVDDVLDININDQCVQVLKNFRAAFNDGKSDSIVIDFASKYFEEAINEGNEAALFALNKLISLKEKIPELKLKSKSSSVCSAYNSLDKIVEIANLNSAFDFYHELGHVFDMNSGYVPDIHFDDIFSHARSMMTANDYKLLNEFKSKYYEVSQHIFYDTNEAFLNQINELGFDDFITFRKYLVDMYSESLNKLSDVKSYVDRLGLKKYLGESEFNASSLADANIKLMFDEVRNNVKNGNKRYRAIDLFSDIVDAIFGGKMLSEEKFYINGITFRYFGHGEGYYNRKLGENYIETIANFIALKLGDLELLDDIKYFMGEEFYNYFEKAFEACVKM